MGYFNFFNDKSKRLSHHGVKGQKWGVRRFQNYNGTRIGGNNSTKSKITKNTKSPEKNSKPSNKNTEKFIRDNMVEDAYGNLMLETKDGVNVSIRADQYNPFTNNYEKMDSENLDKMIHGTANVIDYISNKKNLSEITDSVVKNMENDKWTQEQENVSNKELKDNLTLYGMHVSEVNGDNVYVEMNYEHKDYFSKSAIYGDHSIDLEGTYNMKTKKFTSSTYNSING